MYVDSASVCSCQQCSYASSTSDCDGPCHQGERRPAANDSAQTTASDWCYRCYWSGMLIFGIVDGLFLQLKASTFCPLYRSVSAVSSRFMTNFRFCLLLDLSVVLRFCFASYCVVILLFPCREYLFLSFYLPYYHEENVLVWECSQSSYASYTESSSIHSWFHRHTSYYQHANNFQHWQAVDTKMIALCK